MSAEKLNIGVVGAGAVARDYLAVLSELDEFSVVGIADTDEAARTRSADLCAAPTFASALEMFSEAPFDAALVLTPPGSHEAVCLELLTRGVHVLCEKPIAPTVAAAGRMFHAASRCGVTLMLASKFRYVPDMIEAQRMVADGLIGDVRFFDNAFCSRTDMTGRWNSDPSVSGGGVLIDNGCHSVDIARFMLGPLVRVFTHFGRRTQAIGVEDSARMLFETMRAAVGCIDVSWSLDQSHEYYVSLQGDLGTVQVGWNGSRYRLAADTEWRAFGEGYAKRAAFAAQLGNFAGVVRGAERARVSSEDAMESARAIEAAYRSARVGRWVPLQRWDGS